MTNIRTHLGLACCMAGTLLAAPSAHAGDQQAAATTITYQWANGTVAPQFHEAHRITIRSSGPSEASVIKGVPGKESKATFDPDPAKIKELLDYIHSNGLDVAPPPGSIEPPRPRPGDGTCNLHVEVHGTAYAMPCQGKGVGPLFDMIRALVPASLLDGGKPAATQKLVTPISFGGGVPDRVSATITLNQDFTYELSVSSDSIIGRTAVPPTPRPGRWSFDPASSVVTLQPNDPAVKAGSLTIAFSSPLKAVLAGPDVPHLEMTAIPPAKMKPPSDSPDAATRKIAIRTMNDHFLTAAEGGGLHWIWLDPQHTKFALRTEKGLFVTAVNGGGLGGPNDGRSPFHTDATTAGPDEIFAVSFATDGKVTLRTRKGFYVTAVGGGGCGGPNTVPIHTDATEAGPWQTFRLEDHTQVSDRVAEPLQARAVGFEILDAECHVTVGRAVGVGLRLPFVSR